MRTCEEALEAVAETGRAPLPTAGPAYAGLAEVAYQRNELGRALETVTQGIALCRSFVYTMPLAAGLATLAWIRQAGGDPAGALDAMDEAVQATPGPPGLLNPIPARRARLLLAQGDLGGAARWTEDARRRRTTSRTTPGNRGSWCWRASSLAQDRPGPALAPAPRPAARGDGRPGPARQPDRPARYGRCAGHPRRARRAVPALASAIRWPPRGHVRVLATRDRRWPRCWPG